ncbi:MAG: tetratricopeptide repeat protein, partial [Thermodesulfobacteriota bacterium]|nr:tetratricopeptide repeat protein [Thermodesulfobacteriota bacterium]
CRSIMLREEEGNIYNCFLSFSSNRPAFHLYSGPYLSEMREIFEKSAFQEKSCLHCAGETLSLMRDALKINNRERESGAVSFQVGMEFVKKENYEKALELFDQALDYQVDYENKGTTLISKALCHLRLHEIKDAEAALEEAERHMPSSAMIYYYRGMCEFEQRDYIEAIERFHDVLKNESDEVSLGDVYFYAGLSHIHIEEYDDGLSMMNQAEKFFSNKSIVYYYIGICHLGLEALTSALDSLNKALASDPREEDMGNILFYLGHCYKEMGRYRKAILELEKARETDDMREDIHNLMGFCYFKLKEHHSAIECFRKAVAINPTSAIDYANIGVNLREIGEVSEAILMLKKALHLDPTIGFAQKHLHELREETSK